MGEKIAKQPIAVFFGLVVIINVLFLTWAIHDYPATFLVWQYPFSYAGRVLTLEGIPNTTASRLYSLDMILCGLTMWALAYRYRYGSTHHRRFSRILLTLVAGGGFFIAAFSPDDIRHVSHVIGSALFVAAFWILATTYILDIKKSLSAAAYWSLQALVQLPIFAYAGAYFLSIDPTSYILQKIAVLSILFVLVYVTNREHLLAQE